MNVKIKAIRDSGSANEERLVLQVLRDDDIGYYVVFDTTFTKDGSVSNKVRHTYWFPDKRVRSGDIVVLYTKPGIRSEKENRDGSNSHFFYWGLDKAIWNKEGDCAVLLQVGDWSAKGAF